MIISRLVACLTLFLAACNSDTPSQQFSNTVPAKWVPLEGACFDMGENRVYPEETPITKTCVEPFEIWSHEITNKEFAAFVKATGYITRAELGWSANDSDGPGVDMVPSSAVFVPPKSPRGLNWWTLMDGANWKSPQGPDGSRYSPENPVVHVTREDAQAYAEWAGGRLPTEAEWEYAARGGLNGQLMSWSEAEEIALKDAANTWQGLFPVHNTQDDGFSGIAPIGLYPANGFGLYDMIGNVWEWTASNYYPSHDIGEAEQRFPKGYDPAQVNIPVGVIKGGSFLCARSYCYRYRPAARQPQDLIFGTSHIGFRLVRDSAQ